MKKDRFIRLLDKMKNNNIEEEDITILLNIDEVILERLVDIKDEYLVYAMDIIKYFNKDDKSIVESLDILRESKCDFNACYASDVLTDPDAIKAGIALEGAKIINESDKVYNAEYVYMVLTDTNDAFMDSARVVSECYDEDNIMHTCEVLTNPDVIKTDFSEHPKRIRKK